MCDQATNDESLELLDALEIGTNLSNYQDSTEECTDDAQGIV
ncbi:hypothetical protein [Vibrio kasasachensis]